MRVKIKQWGNSLALRIPRGIASESHIEEDTVVDLTVVNKKLVVRPRRKSKYSLKELVDKITEDNLHEEIQTGPPIGREVF